MLSDVPAQADQSTSVGDLSPSPIPAGDEPSAVDEIEEFDLDDIEVIESKVFG